MFDKINMSESEWCMQHLKSISGFKAPKHESGLNGKDLKTCIFLQLDAITFFHPSEWD